MERNQVSQTLIPMAIDFSVDEPGVTVSAVNDGKNVDVRIYGVVNSAR